MEGCLLNILLMHSSGQVSQRAKANGILCFADAYIFLDIFFWFYTFMIRYPCLPNTDQLLYINTHPYIMWKFIKFMQCVNCEQVLYSSGMSVCVSHFSH